MSEAHNQRVTTKIFSGFLFDMDLKIPLNHNSKWKECHIANEGVEDPLVVVQYESREYIGRYLDYSLVTNVELKKSFQKIKKNLEVFLPEYDFDKLEFFFFPQVFVS